MLGDAALLVRGDVETEDPVQERSLAVVDVAEERDDGRPELELFRFRFPVLEVREHFLFERDRLAEIDFGPQAHCQ